jgi:hypothetical protein
VGKGPLQSGTSPAAYPTVLTFRSGSHTVRVEAADPAAARDQVQAECDRGDCHCPAESCTDDVDSTLLDVRQVALDDVVILSANGVGLGTLYADDTLRRTEPAHG